MNSQNFSRAFKDLVKMQMKKRGLTYQDLAKQLYCSVPTVKRILGPEEISLSRVLEIADWLQLSLTQIEKMIEHSTQYKRVEFSIEQEEFFVEHPHYLTYLMLLHNQLSPEQITEKYLLSEKSTSLYLIRLEKQGFLQVDAKKRVRLKNREFPNFNKDGPLVRAQKNQLMDRFSEFFKRKLSLALNDKKNHKMHMMLSGHVMSEKSYEKWGDKIENLLEQIRAEGLYEEKVTDPETAPLMVFSVMHTLLKPKDPEIRGLEEAFGPIKNI